MSKHQIKKRGEKKKKGKDGAQEVIIYNAAIIKQPKGKKKGRRKEETVRIR